MERSGAGSRREKVFGFYWLFFTISMSFNDVMNNHLAYNVIPDHNARGCSVMWN